MYAIMMLKANKWDRLNLLKGRLVYLADNKPIFKQKYIVLFETGFRRHAGTSSKVIYSFIIHINRKSNVIQNKLCTNSISNIYIYIYIYIYNM